MKRLSLALILSLIAGIAPVASAADAPPPLTGPAPVARPATIGGGVRKPWTPPYVLASINASNLSAVAVIAIGSILLVARSRRKDYE